MRVGALILVCNLPSKLDLRVGALVFREGECLCGCIVNRLACIAVGSFMWLDLGLSLLLVYAVGPRVILLVLL